MAMLLLHGFHLGGRGGTQTVLLIVGLGFAGLLVWAIQRSGRSTT